MIFNSRVIASENTLPALVEGSLDAIPQDAQLLDIGSGSGRLALSLNCIRPDITIVGVEYDTDLAQLPESQQHQHVVAGSAHALPFRDASFDAVIAVNTMHEVVTAPDEPARLHLFNTAIAGVSRILRRGGVFTMFDGVMPSETDTIIAAPVTSEATHLFGTFRAEYLARAPRIEEASADTLTTDVGTMMTFLTKYAYLRRGDAWEGERRQLYPFATKEQIHTALELNGLTVTQSTTPETADRNGLRQLLTDFRLTNQGSGEAYTLDTFPASQMLIQARKHY